MWVSFLHSQKILEINIDGYLTFVTRVTNGSLSFSIEFKVGKEK